MTPVRQDYWLAVSFSKSKPFDLIAVYFVERVTYVAFWPDHDSTIASIVNLTTAVRVIPIGSILIGMPSVLESVTGLDGPLCNTRHPISFWGVQLFNAWNSIR